MLFWIECAQPVDSAAFQFVIFFFTSKITKKEKVTHNFEMRREPTNKVKWRGWWLAAYCGNYIIFIGFIQICYVRLSKGPNLIAFMQPNSWWRWKQRKKNKNKKTQDETFKNMNMNIDNICERERKKKQPKMNDDDNNNSGISSKSSRKSHKT